jgi:sarcosine oxidase
MEHLVAARYRPGWSTMRIAVVGAGIIGLAATYELLRGNAEVRCYEAGEPLRARSAGDTRIFRLAHADPLLVELAIKSRAGWDQWEALAGTQLIGHEGTVVSGPPANQWGQAMAAAGAPFELAEDTPLRDRLPARSPLGPFLHDPAGGVIHAQRAGQFLRDRTRNTLVHAKAHRIEPHERGARLLSDAGPWECDSVIIAAGEGTAALAATAELDMPSDLVHHARFTFTLHGTRASPPCWLDRSEAWRAGFTSYSHPVGLHGLWTIGGSLDPDDTRWELGAAAVIERSRTVVTRYVREHLDGIDPEAVDVLYCNHTASPDSGDGFGAARNGAVLALWGDNLFKMAPLLGTLLAEAAQTLSIPKPLARPVPLVS